MGGLFSSKQPKPKPIVPMPDPDGPEAEAARRRAVQLAQSRSGRASTILSGGDYSSTTTGTP